MRFLAFRVVEMYFRVKIWGVVAYNYYFYLIAKYALDFRFTLFYAVQFLYLEYDGNRGFFQVADGKKNTNGILIVLAEIEA